MLGVPGLMRAWKAGNVGIANAPGAGVADDKMVYAWVPDFIRYFLGEEPLLPNVPTYRCQFVDERRFVLDNLRDLVVKPANESGGYGILIGNRATDAQLAAQVEAIEANPRNWVAQPIISISTAPTLCGDAVESRHVDLRPFILTGASSYVTAGGLTRVALPKGSLIVNSSQGGGSKDTWIVDLGRPSGPAVMTMLLARVAGRLYWAARYIERGEDTARLVRGARRADGRSAAAHRGPLGAARRRRRQRGALRGGRRRLPVPVAIPVVSPSRSRSRSRSPRIDVGERPPPRRRRWPSPGS